MNDIYAVCDLGTNSARLMLCRLEGETIIPLVKELKTIRLGDGVHATGDITAFTIAQQTVIGFMEQAEAAGAKEFYIFATSAVREANNQKEFVDHILKHCGVEIEVVSGETEATLAFMGIRSDAERKGVIDIGGGSTEIVLGGTGVEYFKSYPIGAVRGLNLHGMSNLDTFAKEVYELIEVPKTVYGATFFAVGGSATSLCAIAQELTEYDSKKVDGYKLTYDEVCAVTDKLLSLKLEERKLIPSLDIRRADIIPFGAVILREVMKKLKIDSVTVSEQDNLEGYLLYKKQTE